LCAGRGFNTFANVGNLAVNTQNIGSELAVCVNYRTSTNQNCTHVDTPEF
jgi:hypothetical protein